MRDKARQRPDAPTSWASAEQSDRVCQAAIAAMEYQRRSDRGTGTNPQAARKRSRSIRRSKAWCRTWPWTRGGELRWATIWWISPTCPRSGSGREFYQDELPLLKKGLPVTVTAVIHIPAKSSPEKLRSLTRSSTKPRARPASGLKSRIRDFKLRPEMYVNVELAMDLAKASPCRSMPSCHRRAQHRFRRQRRRQAEPRFVELGRKFGDELRSVKSACKPASVW